MVARGGQEAGIIADEPVDTGGFALPGSGSGGENVAPGNPFIQNPWFDLIYGQIDNPFPGISLGPPIDRRDIIIPPVRRLPKVVSGSGPFVFPGLLKQIVGGNIPQITEVLPVPVGTIVPPLPPVRTGPPTEVGGPEPTSIHTGGDEMPDLGSIFEGHFGLPGWEGLADLGASLVGFGNTTGGQPPPPAVIPPTVVSVPPGGGGLPPMGGGGACESDPRNEYVLKFSCGQWKWVKKRKRRTKRLASASDIKDLSSLMGVLGNGKNLTTWIATHR